MATTPNPLADGEWEWQHGVGVQAWNARLSTSSRGHGDDEYHRFAKKLEEEKEAEKETHSASATDAFESYIRSGEDAGLDDTAGSRLKRTQVAQMEASLNDVGLNGRQTLADALADSRNAQIAEAWQIEADEEFGCPMALTNPRNVVLLFTCVGLLLLAAFYLAYASTPDLSDEELRREAVLRFREEVAAAKAVGEQSSEAEEETGIEAQIFLGVSLALGLLFALTKHQASDEQREDEGMAPGPAAEL